MKRALALLLVLIMVVPMGLAEQADGAKADVQPFYMVNWSPIEGEFDNVLEFAQMWMRTPAADVDSWEDLYMTSTSFGGNTPELIAKNMKEDFDTRPEGTRIMFYPTNKLHVNAENHIYMDKMVKMMTDYLDNLLKIYKDMGGKLDGIVLDSEYNEFTVYNFDKYVLDDPLIYKKVVENPLYKTRVRPLLEERGFKFWTDITDYSPEIYGINKNAGAGYEDCPKIWNAAMRDLYVIYMEETMAPLFKYYPEASLSNYRYYATESWKMPMIDENPTMLNQTEFGTAANETCYNWRPGKSYYVNEKTSAPTFAYPVGYNNAVYEGTPFNMFLWNAQIYKNALMSHSNKKLSVWVSSYNYSSGPYTTCNTPYYAEMLLQLGLMNADFIGYMVPRDCKNDYAGAQQVVSDVLHELTRMVGAKDRKFIYTDHDWNASYVLNGMYAGGKNVWRLTPDTSNGETLDSFKVDAKDPTFYINGKTITFPGGKIVETSKISIVGSCGYWIETADDVMPVITTDVDRYRKYPAFQENYDLYEAGKEYTYDGVEHKTSWVLKKGANGSAMIQADKDGNGNVLALSGTYSLKNDRVPKNITAGDTYAENQTWEVTATIPANMAADAELCLFEIYSDKSKPIDFGLKIAGGKLYYSNKGEYVEFEGVDLSAGGKFTFKRMVDFRKEGEYYSNYVVCDATGNEVGKVNKAMFKKGQKLPVQAIGISCANIAGEPILLDNYKLYASGVATDFSLYDVKTGDTVQDITVARDKDTAYRLSWLNGTSTEKVYSVVAAIYEGDNKVSESVVAEVKMAPNTDGVVTDVIKNEEGKSVLVYLRNDNPPEEEETPVVGTEPTQEPDDKQDKNTAPDIMIIIIAGAAVLVIVAVVVVLLVLKKKKAVKAPAETETPNESSDETSDETTND